MNRLNTRAVLSCGTLLIALCVPLAAASSTTRSERSAPNQSIVAFSSFLESQRSAQPREFVGRHGFKVENEKAFEEMRQHIMLMQSGEIVAHSFELGRQIFDCVPVMLQASARVMGLHALPSPPPHFPAPKAGNSSVRGTPQTMTTRLDGSLDASGNARRCAEGTVAIRRLTIQEIAHYRTLHNFFDRERHGQGRVVLPKKYYSHIQNIQRVANLGGYSVLNIWRPQVNFDLDERHSLSQEWYVGGSGAAYQTVELGWDNGKYGNKEEHSTEDSVFFIFWTANNYGNGNVNNIIGCFDLDCAGFMLTNNNYCVGCKFSKYSTTQGTQYEIPLGAQLYQGNWWIAVGSDWIGYYPGSVFNGGQLTKNAQAIAYGGEVSALKDAWPFMGSGHFAEAGFKSAAYQRLIQYWNTQGALTTPAFSETYASVPKCYTQAGPFSGGASWGSYFFFGGPGGSGCQEK